METGRGLGEDHACDRRTSSKAECWDLFHLHPLSHMPKICFLPLSLYKLKKYTILTVLHVCLIGDWFKDVIDRVGGHIGLPLSNLILLFFTFPTTTTTTRTCVLCGVYMYVLCVAVYICVSVFAGEQCICVSAMVHQHNESLGHLANRPYGPAVACLSAENSHQSCEGKYVSINDH